MPGERRRESETACPSQPHCGPAPKLASTETLPTFFSAIQRLMRSAKEVLSREHQERLAGVRVRLQAKGHNDRALRAVGGKDESDRLLMSKGRARLLPSCSSASFGGF